MMYARIDVSGNLRPETAIMISISRRRDETELEECQYRDQQRQQQPQRRRIADVGFVEGGRVEVEHRRERLMVDAAFETEAEAEDFAEHLQPIDHVDHQEKE